MIDKEQTSCDRKCSIPLQNPLKLNLSVVFPTDILQWIILCIFIVLIQCAILVWNLYAFPCTEYVPHNFSASAFKNTCHIKARSYDII
jgi:hypothetical protein